MPNLSLPTLTPTALLGIACAASIALSMLLTRLITRLAIRFGWVREPSSARHVHTQPIPRLGGLAIFLSVCALLACARAIPGLHPQAYAAMHVLWRILLPAALLFAVGLWDDCRPLPARFKLACQIASGLWLYALGYSVSPTALMLPQAFSMRIVGVLATVIWVVWITNAVNLIDGLDGLAAGSSLLSLVTLFIAAIMRGNYAGALGTALLGGAVIGFLRYNFNPASIFLGDGGSLFIGFMLSALGLVGGSQTKSPLVIAVALPALAFGLPLTEVVLSVTRRFLSGKRLFEPDRMHIHHRLLDRGLPHRNVVLVLYAVSGVFGLLALVMVYPTPAGLAASFAVLVVLGIAGLVKLRYPEFAELAKLPRRALQQRRVIANTLVLNRAIDQLTEAHTIADVQRALETGFPAQCFQQMRFAIFPRTSVGRSHLFALGVADLPMLVVRAAAPAGAPRHKARLVMDLETPYYQGTLEFVVHDSAEHILLNINSIFAHLHPALNQALCRLAPHVDTARPELLPVLAFPHPLPPTGTDLRLLHN